jgi:uncharacterized protein
LTGAILFSSMELTTYNNPAFQLFLMATHDAYRLRWTATESDLLLVSVGTGTCPMAHDQLPGVVPSRSRWPRPS